MKYGNLTFGQVEALVNKIGGMTVVERILQGGNISDAITKLLALANAVYRVTVDRDKKLKVVIAAGRYDWTNSDITDKHFPVEGSGTVEIDIELVHYGRDMSTDAVLKDLDARGLRPIKIEELLALGAVKPDLQREFPIIALGSVWRLDGFRFCPYLDRDGSERGLCLDWIGSVFREFCRFAAVRK